MEADFEVEAEIETLGKLRHGRNRDDILRRADEHGERGHRHRLDAGLAQARDGQRAGALRQPLAR